MSVKVRMTLVLAFAVVAMAIGAMTINTKPAHAYVSGNSVVAEAQSYLGVPYVWGGSSRYGVDCSGLTKAVYGAFGIYLPHYTGSQYGYGSWSSYTGAGDLVFSDYGYGFASHVGIATGDGNMINAPYPGTVVRYDPIYSGYVNAVKSIV